MILGVEPLISLTREMLPFFLFGGRGGAVGVIVGVGAPLLPAVDEDEGADDDVAAGPGIGSGLRIFLQSEKRFMFQ